MFEDSVQQRVQVHTDEREADHHHPLDVAATREREHGEARDAWVDAEFWESGAAFAETGRCGSGCVDPAG